MLKISLKSNVVKLAFRILRRNYGCPGLDGMSLKEIKENYDFHYRNIVRRFEEDDINSQPIKQVEIMDYGGGERSIFVYCVYERWLQQCLKIMLEDALGDYLSPCVFGYRPGFNMDMLKKYIKSFNKKYVLCLDLKGFFDNIDQSILLGKLKDRINGKKKVLYNIKKSISHISNGLPQGNALSPMLSNFYLSDFDKLYEKDYARFSDNLFFAVDSKGDKEIISQGVALSIQDLELEINEKKTKLYERQSF